MKESDAKLKWCPMVRYLAVFENTDGKRECAGSYNRGAEDSALPKCLGSDCMMFIQTSEPPITESIHGDCGLKVTR